MFALPEVQHLYQGLWLLWLGDHFDQTSLSPIGFLSFYAITMFMLATGGASMPVLENFFGYQLMWYEEEGKELDWERIGGRLGVWTFVAWLVALIPNNVLYGLEWRPRLMVSVAMVGISVVVFACGSCFHQYHSIPSNCIFLVNDVIRVFKAAFLKRNITDPPSPHNFFHNQRNKVSMLPRLQYLRFLDKAAVPESPCESGSAEEQVQQGRLCTTTQVRQTKVALITMVPLFPASVGLGLVNAAGIVFFVQQAIFMEPQISVTTLFTIRSIAEVVVPFLYNQLLELVIPDQTKIRRFLISIKIFQGMAISIVCCVVAWHIEVQRLTIVKEKGLVEYPYATIPMSRWRLASQFFLLGSAYGLSQTGMDDFQRHYVSLPLTPLIECFCLTTGGCLNMILLIIPTGWFGNSLNSSRLDKYLILMGLLASVATLLFGFGILLFNALDADLELQAAKFNDRVKEDVESPPEAQRNLEPKALEFDVLEAESSAVSLHDRVEEELES